MIKINMIILTLAWFFVLVLPLSAEEMKIGYNHMKTLLEIQESSEKPVGSLVDYWVAMAEKMGVSVKWVGPLPSQRILLYLKKNIIDVGYIASKNKERAKIVSFPEKPIIIRQTIVCLKRNSSITKIENWSDLKYLNKIGVVHGYRGSAKLEKDYPALNLAMMTHENFIDIALSLLRKSKLNAFVFPDKKNVMSVIKKRRMEGSTKVLDAPEPPVLYFGLFAHGRPGLLEKYNQHHDEVEFAPNY